MKYYNQLLCLTLLSVLSVACKNDKETPEEKIARHTWALFSELDIEAPSSPTWNKERFNKIKAEIDSGAQVNYHKSDEHYGLSPLAFLARVLQSDSTDSSENEIIYDVVKILVQSGANIHDSSDESGWTPLQYAVSMGGCDNPRYIDALIDCGAEVNLRYPDSLRQWNIEQDSLPRYPVTNAIIFHRPEALKVLLKNGADVPAKTCDNAEVVTLREYALRHSDTIIVNILDSVSAVRKKVLQ